MGWDVGRPVRFAVLLIVGVAALAGCGSSGSVSAKTSPTAASLTAAGSSGSSSAKAASPSPSSSSRFTGPLTFRPVLWDSAAGTPMPSAADAAETHAETVLNTLNCSQPDKTPSAAAGDPLPACSLDGKIKYLLGPSALSGSHVNSATSAAADGIWRVDVALDSAGAKAFGDLTTSLAGTGKLVAITVGGVVVSAPTVQQPITDGKLQITGQFDQQKAADLAAALIAGAKG